MSGLGDTLRGARERRGETIAAAAEAVGAEVAQIETLEGERLDDLPDALDRAGLVDRYASTWSSIPRGSPRSSRCSMATTPTPTPSPSPFPSPGSPSATRR